MAKMTTKQETGGLILLLYLQKVTIFKMKQHSLFITLCLAVSVVVPSCKDKVTEHHSSPVRVETAEIDVSHVSAGKSYSGVIEESNGTVLSFKVPGTIMNIAVSEGQRVSKGQLIATLDDSSLRSSYEISKAALATAQDTYDRMKMLHDANSLPEMKWVEVQNSLNAAQAACQIAKNTLDDARIYAPFSGIVSQKIADAGSTAAPGVPVVKIVEVSPVKASISVPENEIGSFTATSEAAITVESAGVTVQGKMTEKGVAADPLSRTYTVKFVAANPDASLLPGMLCNVSVLTEESVNAVVIPVESVLLDSGNQAFVWVVNNGKAEKRNITLGAYTATGVIVEQGLATGDIMIVAGQQKVSQGMEVTSINR